MTLILDTLVQAATVLPPVEPSTYGSPKGSAARIYRAAG